MLRSFAFQYCESGKVLRMQESMRPAVTAKQLGEIAFLVYAAIYAHLRIAGRLIAHGRTKPRRALLLNQDRKIPGFRSHRTGALHQTRLISLSISPSRSRSRKRGTNKSRSGRRDHVCAATKALTHYLSCPLSVLLSVSWSRALPLRPSFLRYSSHRTSSCVPPARNKTQI